MQHWQIHMLQRIASMTFVRLHTCANLTCHKDQIYQSASHQQFWQHRYKRQSIRYKGPSFEPVEPDLALHPGFLEPSLEFPEPCWTWPVSAPNPRPSREPSEPSPWAEDPVSLRCWGQTADLCADPCWTKSVEVQDTRSWKIDWEERKSVKTIE